MMAQQNYAALALRLKKEILHSAHIRATLSADMHLLGLHRKIGKAIAHKGNLEGGATPVVSQIAKDLYYEFSDMSGLKHSLPTKKQIEKELKNINESKSL